MIEATALELLAKAIALKESGLVDPFDNIHVRAVLVEHAHGKIAGTGDLGMELAWALTAEYGPQGPR